jgi:DNA-binding response OmpR family regulator
METVFVVEDDRSLQRVLERLFRADLLEVLLAGEGLTTEKLFAEHLPSAVVLDLNLPGKNGRELCREFKAHAPQVPVIILTANADIAHRVLLPEGGSAGGGEIR